LIGTKSNHGFVNQAPCLAPCPIMDFVTKRLAWHHPQSWIFQPNFLLGTMSDHGVADQACHVFDSI